MRPGGIESSFAHFNFEAAPAGAVLIPLTRGFSAVVDADDAARVLTHPWRLDLSKDSSTPYGRSTIEVGGKRRSVQLHRFIINAPDGVLVDHRSRNGLDCRRSNLRLATYAQNTVYSIRMPGKSGFRGVSATKGAHLGWAADIKVEGRTLRLGIYDAAEEAARAYDAAAVRYFGCFAVLNFPGDGGAIAAGPRPARRSGASGFRGVTIDRSVNTSGIYRAQLSVSGKIHRLGRFKTAEEAAKAYDAAVRRLCPDTSALNFPAEAA